jgi:alkylation response protein AidB-like acyl-CoA dehydrogenase
MDKQPTPDTFEGSAKAREFIARLGAFFETELHPLAQAHGVDHDNAPSRELLQQVWQRSQALGFYGMTLPEAMGGAGFTVHDHALIKEFIYASGTPFAPHVLGELTGPPRLGGRARQKRPWFRALWGRRWWKQ